MWFCQGYIIAVESRSRKKNNTIHGGDVVGMENGCLEDYTPEIQHTYPKYPYVKGDSLPETNMAPENQWLEDVFPFGMAHFQGLC